MHYEALLEVVRRDILPLELAFAEAIVTSAEVRRCAAYLPDTIEDIHGPKRGASFVIPSPTAVEDEWGCVVLWSMAGSKSARRAVRGLHQRIGFVQARCSDGSGEWDGDQSRSSSLVSRFLGRPGSVLIDWGMLSGLRYVRGGADRRYTADLASFVTVLADPAAETILGIERDHEAVNAIMAESGVSGWYPLPLREDEFPDESRLEDLLRTVVYAVEQLGYLEAHAAL